MWALASCEPMNCAAQIEARFARTALSFSRWVVLDVVHPPQLNPMIIAAPAPAANPQMPYCHLLSVDTLMVVSSQAGPPHRIPCLFKPGVPGTERTITVTVR